jgi:fluoroacetyl-CoA thioesterase
MIGEGRHERMIIPWTRFVARVNEKAKAARVAQIERVVNSE